MQRRSGHGGYTLKYLFTPSKYSNDSEPNDEKGQGDEIAMGGTVQGHLGYRDATDYVDDNDWYKIVVPEDGRVDLIYNCEQTYELKLNWMDFRWYKASNNDYPSRESTGWYPNPSDTLTIGDAGKGTYYIQMQRKSGHGGYTLKYVFTRNNTPVDEEPNNEADQATQVIENDGIATGHLGYRDENDNTDKDDWFKLDTRNSGVMLVVTIETDSNSNLAFNWVDIIRVKDGKSNSVASSGWYPTGKISITTNEVDEDATYYVHLQHKSGHGSYTVSYGSPQRYEGSQIRITYLGRNTTRLGIPSPYDVKVENIGSGNWNASLTLTWNRALDKQKFWHIGNELGLRYNKSTSLASAVTSNSVPSAASLSQPQESRVGSFTLNYKPSIRFQKENLTLQARGDISYRNFHRNITLCPQPTDVWDINYGLNGSYKLPWNFTFDTDFTVHSRRGYTDAEMNDNRLYWDASLTKSFHQGQWILKLRGYDLLGQVSNLRYSINAQGRTETWTNTMRRYALLTVSYRFSQKPKKENK
jgi:hypothetical protein